MTDYEAAFRNLTDKWHESVKHYEERIEKLETEIAELQSKVSSVRLAAKYAAKIRDARIEKLEAALRALKAMHHEGGIDDLQERDDRTYFMVCDALDAK